MISLCPLLLSNVNGGIERWRIRWAFVDDKPESTRHSIYIYITTWNKRDLYPAIYSIISILLTMLMATATSERSFSEMKQKANIFLFKGVSMIRVDFGPISETVYIDIILNTIIER
jgi:hypothetical protein